MRLSFEWEINSPIPAIKQAYRELICKHKGHLYKKYEEPKTIFYDYFLMQAFLGNLGKPTKECSRCFKVLYKKVKEEKAKTITFSRYAPLRKTPKTATELHIKKK